MHNVHDRASLSRVLHLPIDIRLKQLLIERCDQLGGDVAGIARLIVVQGGDSLQALEAELGFDILKDADGLSFPDPGFSGGRWDWLAFHGHTFEMCIEGTDDFTHVVLIQNSPMQNRLLRALCLTYAD